MVRDKVVFLAFRGNVLERDTKIRSIFGRNKIEERTNAAKKLGDSVELVRRASSVFRSRGPPLPPFAPFAPLCPSLPRDTRRLSFTRTSHSDLSACSPSLFQSLCLVCIARDRPGYSPTHARDDDDDDADRSPLQRAHRERSLLFHPPYRIYERTRRGKKKKKKNTGARNSSWVADFLVETLSHRTIRR